MTGLELLPRIKALRPDVPVTMITAYGDADTKRRALEAGAQGLLTKPIDFAAVKAEINTLIKEKHTQPSIPPLGHANGERG